MKRISSLRCIPIFERQREAGQTLTDASRILKQLAGHQKILGLCA